MQTMHWLDITKSEIETKNITRCQQVCTKMAKSGEAVGGKLILSFQGYDDDHREVFEIAEIRSWVDKLFEEFPTVLYFASRDDTAPTDNMLMMCWLDVQYMRSSEHKGDAPERFPMYLDYKSKAQKLSRVVASSVEYARERGDLHTAMQILQRLGIPPEEFL